MRKLPSPGAGSNGWEWVSGPLTVIRRQVRGLQHMVLGPGGPQYTSFVEADDRGPNGFVIDYFVRCNFYRIQDKIAVPSINEMIPNSLKV